ncbi:hypothetical protein [Mycobacterium vicinigordonae]|uniref:Uncharacterized protein n=1 Tax=Mycobacterium vicinigordonae TaxID=1719132 RepID=A0A7D6E0A7_9MYCO|nr:hypothetical protein [Mycobacterium vicinigordonae]QLL08808.1 hypothetical protein H0P51_07845 [Mycobacterium vicinigordonae]
MLSRAVEYSPFHRSRLSGIDLTGIDPTDLSPLPVMTKAEMMNALDEVFTDRRLCRRDVEKAIATTKYRPVPILNDFIALASGGCSGQRGLFVYDRAATASFLSAIARPPVEAILAPTAPVRPPRIAMVAAPSAVHATGLLTPLTEGPDASAHPELVPATRRMNEVVDRLNTLQPEVLGGYAIFDSFGSTEGLFGKTGPDDEVFAFNTDMCIVELVDANNRPVAPGAPSAKVLVTNLYNLVQPLIRYELTDIFTRQPDAAEHGHLRARVQGRSDEVLRYQDITSHPIAIRSVMATTPEVVDYQVHQTDCGIDVFAVFDGHMAREDLAGRLRRALTDAGLGQPCVKIHAVDRVDRHPLSGKLRRFVPIA